MLGTRFNPDPSTGVARLTTEIRHDAWVDTLELQRGGTDDPDGRRGRRLLRGVATGQYLRLAPGTFVEAASWTSAAEHDRHVARVGAVMPTLAERSIVSHASAVAMLGLPWIGPFPDRIVVTDPTRTTGQRRVRVDRVGGAGRDIRTVDVGGVAVTAPVVTAVDIALRYDRRRALSVLDAVMRSGVGREQLLAELDGRPRARASTRAHMLIELADAGAASVGESVSRLVMHDLGMPAPVLQQAFRDRRGQIGVVDFWFPEQGIIVEFDGIAKYTDPRYRNGRTPDQVVVDEKIREDRLRAHEDTTGVARLLWRDVMPRGTAPAILRSAGLPMTSRLDRVPED